MVRARTIFLILAGGIACSGIVALCAVFGGQTGKKDVVPDAPPLKSMMIPGGGIAGIFPGDKSFGEDGSLKGGPKFEESIIVKDGVTRTSTGTRIIVSTNTAMASARKGETSSSYRHRYIPTTLEKVIRSSTTTDAAPSETPTLTNVLEHDVTESQPAVKSTSEAVAATEAPPKSREAPEEEPQETSREMPKGESQKTGQGALEKEPQETSRADTPKGAPQKAPKKKPQKGTKEEPQDPHEKSHVPSEEVFQEEPQRIPQEVPKESSQEVPHGEQEVDYLPDEETMTIPKVGPEDLQDVESQPELEPAGLQSKTEPEYDQKPAEESTTESEPGLEEEDPVLADAVKGASKGPQPYILGTTEPIMNDDEIIPKYFTKEKGIKSSQEMEELKNDIIPNLNGVFILMYSKF
ncbi:hypothetical protein TWF102_001563 [Orbilia oligospora]|uniref:Uncharacterized protein n=1 Tax=Orbilia oligospora TaxID=2813651 RepID=A0A7C8NH78_ORBOL|nr:hypothetical protein TWF102_001563 [Orbilia oligospora]